MNSYFLYSSDVQEKCLVEAKKDNEKATMADAAKLIKESFNKLSDKERRKYED